MLRFPVPLLDAGRDLVLENAVVVRATDAPARSDLLQGETAAITAPGLRRKERKDEEILSLAALAQVNFRSDGAGEKGHVLGRARAAPLTGHRPYLDAAQRSAHSWADIGPIGQVLRGGRGGRGAVGIGLGDGSAAETGAKA